MRVARDGTRLKAEFAVARCVGCSGAPQVAEYLGDLYLWELRYSYGRVQASADRATQQRRHLTIAFALAARKLDAGSYPAALTDLIPKYLAEVPDDLFAGRPSGYKRTEAGYELTGVGEPGNVRPTLDRLVVMPRPVEDD